MAPDDSYQVSQSDCCGNGCVNCILDISPLRITRSELCDKTNVLLSYRLYKLLACDEIRPKILQMHFKSTQETADSNQILYVPPGHHLMLRAPAQFADASQTSAPRNAAITRPYSPFWSDMNQLEFKILVNLRPNGILSKYIEKLQPGDQVEFRGPVGTFQHDPQAYSSLLLICHGVAIAPLLAIIQDILNDHEDMTRIQLFACFENLQTALFREELHELSRFWNFNRKLYLSRPEVDFASKLKYKEDVIGQRLDYSEVKNYTDSCKDLKTLACVISGSKEFQEHFTNILLDIGLDISAINLL